MVDIENDHMGKGSIYNGGSMNYHPINHSHVQEEEPTSPVNNAFGLSPQMNHGIPQKRRAKGSFLHNDDYNDELPTNRLSDGDQPLGSDP